MKRMDFRCLPCTGGLHPPAAVQHDATGEFSFANTAGFQVTSMTNQLPIALALVLLLAACSQTPSRPDLLMDIVLDGASDISPDATPDATSDAGQDTGPIEPGLDDPPFARHIDPFIGTQDGFFNVGSAYPGPGTPFGMVKVGPDTGDEYGQVYHQHCAGYRWADPLIFGFSHNHLHGTGIPDYGDFQAMPMSANETAKNKPDSFAREYSKESEVAEAGYYAVTLRDPEIRVELTATPRCAHHRYTWPEGSTTGTIAIDYGSGLVVKETSLGGHADMQDGVVLVTDHHIGDFSKVFGGFDVHAAIRFRTMPDAVGVWKDDQLTRGTARIDIPKGDSVKWGGWFEFDLSAGRTVEMQVCLSYTSTTGALANMAELPGWDFDGVRLAAFNAWENYVGRFRLSGGDDPRREIFYTSLYHTALMPQLASDVDGSYLGFDGLVHVARDWNYYSELSLWDTFRTQQPLLALVWPEVHRDINRSLIEMARQGGNLPMWPLANGDTECMIGQHAATVITDSYLKGIRDFDIDFAFDVLADAANNRLGAEVYGTRIGVEPYNASGWVPADGYEASVSMTLEYAFNDFCLAELAAALELPEGEAVFRARSQNFRNVWDPDLMFFRERKADGTWRAAPDKYDPTVMTFGLKNQGYTEGSGWQYRWFAPHDPAGLIAMYGSADTFVTLLTEFFQTAADSFDFRTPTGFYYHGNEPDIHAAFMFNDAGRPDLAQYWARWILDNNYRNEPEGLVGNDDAGTLAAWYVFAASGLYPSPCLPGYFVTSPAFDEVTIKLPGGDLVVKAPGASGDAIYITDVKFNGQPLESTNMWITHELMKNGGVLEMTVSDTPPQG